MKAIRPGAVVADSEEIVTVEGNACCPRQVLREHVIRPGARTGIGPSKGVAHSLRLGP
jgi:hypothetical protein